MENLQSRKLKTLEHPIKPVAPAPPPAEQDYVDLAFCSYFWRKKWKDTLNNN